MRVLVAVAIVASLVLTPSPALLFAGEQTQAAVRIGVADSMFHLSVKLPVDANPEVIAWQHPLRIQLAKNEFESGHVVIEAPADRPLRRVRVNVGALVCEGSHPGRTWLAQNISLWREDSIEVYNLWAPHNNLGPYPDPLRPLEDAFDVPSGRCQPVLVRFHATSELSAGTYRGTVAVSAADIPEIRLPVEVTVWNLALPVEQHFTLTIPIWGGQMEQMYPGSQTPQRRRAYLDMLYDHRVAPFPLAEDEIPHAIERGMRDFCLVCFAKDGVEPEKAKRVGEQAAQWHERGWDRLARSYVLLGDEAPRDCYPYLREQGRLIGEAGPQVARRFTVSPEMIQDIGWIGQELHGLADTLILGASPGVTDRLSRDARAAGFDLWWYYVAQHYYIPTKTAEARFVFWRHWKYQVPGQLHWGMSYWGDDNIAGRDGKKWPDIPWNTKSCRSGDGYLVYPAPSGAALWPSLRLEQLRDGIEDYEYLYQMKQLTDRLPPAGGQTVAERIAANRLLLDIDRALVQSYAEYDKRPNAYRSYRQRVAEAILATQEAAGEK
jgi:hypothetical protein